MTARRPTLEELAGGELGPAERDRLLRVHELLLQAGPPPELSARTEQAPVPPPRRLHTLPGRLRLAALGAAAAIAIALFGAGYLLGDRSSPADAFRTIELRGQSGARASLVVLRRDAAGNWPMRLLVSGLPPLPPGGTYELWLTKGGRLAEPCGSFAVVASGTTEVQMSTPYPLRDYDAWVVVRAGTTARLLSSA